MYSQMMKRWKLDAIAMVDTLPVRAADKLLTRELRQQFANAKLQA